MLGFQGGVSIPLVKGGVKAPPAKRQCRAAPKAWLDAALPEPNPDDKADAVRMDACARGGNDQCSIQPWGGQIEAVIERLKGRRLPELKQPQGQTNAKQQ
jgi:hypothetical protein